MQIGLFRESGGLGDVVMMGGAVRRLKAEGHEVYFIGFGEYRDVVDHMGYDGMYELLSAVRNRRRKRLDVMRVNDKDYFQCVKWLGYDRIYDMFCPGYNHEAVAVSDGGSITVNRVEAFQLACGFTHDFVAPKWEVSEEELKMAQRWLDVQQIKNEKGIVLHIRATDIARSYKYFKLLCIKLKEKGYQPILMDSVESYEHDKFVTYIWKEPLWLKASIIKLTNKFIGVDSGFFHIAAAIGARTYSLWGPTDGEQTSKLYRNNINIVTDDYFDSKHECHPMLEGIEIVCKPPCIHAPVACRSKLGCKYLNNLTADKILAVMEGKQC